MPFVTELTRRFCGSLTIVVAFATAAFIPGAAHAQIKTVSFYSGNTLTDAANANYSKNLTTVTNGGAAVYSNGVTVSFSTTYASPTPSTSTIFATTPTASGTGNAFTPTATVTRDSGLIGYEGGLVTGAGAALSPFSSAAGGGQQGYYMFQVPFTLTGFTSGQNYSLNGEVHSDNETFDVILDYGTANYKILTLSGTDIRSTANAATTDGKFTGSATQIGTNLNHTLSYIIYNESGAMTTSFNFTAATPEPPSFVLFGAIGVPGLAGAALARRRNRNAK